MFQKGTGERFKYKAAVLEKYPTAVCKKRHNLFAIMIGEKRFSDAYATAENAWANAWGIMKDEEKNQRHIFIFKREFKFRIYERSTKRMRYFNSFFDLIQKDQHDNLDVFFIAGPGEYPHKWQQFICMQDKNKKDIYEGDIMKCTDDAGKEIIFVCEYGIARRELISGAEVDIPGFYFLKQDGHKSFPIAHNYLGMHDLDMIEVIGNIDENPELVVKFKLKNTNA